MHLPIDLRSDTVTRAPAAMREAMARAEVGDDVYGEDPTVALLERRVAELLGKEAALFFPTGTMANQAAIGAQAGPGDEVICEAGAHVVAFEGGALSALWGAQARPLPGQRGLLSAAQVAAAIQPPGNDHFPASRLLCVENTANRGGGTVWPLALLEEVSGVAHRAGLAVHLDGARLWNASAASGVALADYAACADTVSVCLSKGLGAPAGSLVATSAEFAPKLRRLRKRLGGGLRQVGHLAAAGLYALEHHLPRLAEDHEKARRIATALADVPGLSVAPVETNIVYVELADGLDSASLLHRLREAGVLAGSDGPRKIRLVTHFDVAPEACDEAARRIAGCL
ncbi:threonine aldolase family protein [Vulgatibacter sp.]|uniref:threonine aldolase family protein n=1 Tax=Vulgatibacter sp. TaxID=1971226 RepID=UPI00356A6949